MESETISFRCRGELKDWLESYADERMVTVSMAAQEIIAEKYRQERDASQETNTTPEVSDSEDRSESDGQPDESEESEPPDPVQQVLDLHDDKWRTTKPGSDSKYATERADGRTKYYKTREGLAARLAKEYGASGISISTKRIENPH